MRSYTKTINPDLTAAQVNALDGTPINIIPAPPAGYMIAIDDFIVSKTSGTAAASYITARGISFKVAEAGSALTGVGVDISAPGSTIGSFDGTLQVTATFRIVKIG